MLNLDFTLIWDSLSSSHNNINLMCLFNAYLNASRVQLKQTTLGHSLTITYAYFSNSVFKSTDFFPIQMRCRAYRSANTCMSLWS